MQIIDIIGFIAGGLTTIAFLPQVIKTLREKRSRDIALGLCILNAGAGLLWTSYGFLADKLPLIIPNAIGSALGLSLLYLKIKYK
jgi:MtN3 and saliva related transmembrane protein